jgi:hypothetical protein
MTKQLMNTQLKMANLDNLLLLITLYSFFHNNKALQQNCNSFVGVIIFEILFKDDAKLAQDGTKLARIPLKIN